MDPFISNLKSWLFFISTAVYFSLIFPKNEALNTRKMASKLLTIF